MFEIVDTQPQEAVIKVVGVGGCGGNAVDHMINEGVEGVDFICANTDAQALRRNKAKTLLQLGPNVTKGLGAGANPDIGREAAMEDRERIIELIEGADMLFLTAGMGGGTGTGAAPVVAEAARELGILTVAVVTKPFAFEGKRQKIAQDGLDALTEQVNSLIVVPNDKLMQVLGNQVTWKVDITTAIDSIILGHIHRHAADSVAGGVSEWDGMPRTMTRATPITALMAIVSPTPRNTGTTARTPQAITPTSSNAAPAGRRFPLASRCPGAPASRVASFRIQPAAPRERADVQSD